MRTIKASTPNRPEGFRERLLDKGGYGIIESLMAIIVMGVLVVVVIERYERVAYEAKQTALKAELGNLRQAITLFRIMKGRYPKDLKELVGSQYVMPYQEDPFIRKYLEPNALDESMNVLDPFGLPYSYSPSDGSVRTRKEGFEGW